MWTPGRAAGLGGGGETQGPEPRATTAAPSSGAVPVEGWLSAPHFLLRTLLLMLAE